MEEGQLLTTKRGRAELLLLPGVFLKYRSRERLGCLWS